MLLRTLSFSVSSKSFACHSYENCRGVYQLFPIWNPALQETALHFCRPNYPSLFDLSRCPCAIIPNSLSPFFSYTCALFCTHQKINSFIFKRLRTLCEKPPGVGVPRSFTETQMIPIATNMSPSPEAAAPLPSTGRGLQNTCHTCSGCRLPRRMLRFGVP